MCCGVLSVWCVKKEFSGQIRTLVGFFLPSHFFFFFKGGGVFVFFLLLLLVYLFVCLFLYNLLCVLILLKVWIQPEKRTAVQIKYSSGSTKTSLTS